MRWWLPQRWLGQGEASAARSCCQTCSLATPAGLNLSLHLLMCLPPAPALACAAAPTADDQAHGTHVAGVLGAIGNNLVGVTGAAWGTSMYICKADAPPGFEGFLSSAAMLDCYSLCSEVRGAGAGAVQGHGRWRGQHAGQHRQHRAGSTGGQGQLRLAVDRGVGWQRPEGWEDRWVGECGHAGWLAGAAGQAGAAGRCVYPRNLQD